MARQFRLKYNGRLLQVGCPTHPTVSGSAVPAMLLVVQQHKTQDCWPLENSPVQCLLPVDLAPGQLRSMPASFSGPAGVTVDSNISVAQSWCPDPVGTGRLRTHQTNELGSDFIETDIWCAASPTPSDSCYS
eukprot:SAG11_NODE_838_length_6918_cov_3.566945_5_plen_132_part_00